MKALAITAAASIGALAAAIIWFAVVGDPMGGEPVAVLKIDPTSRPASALESVAPKPVSRAGKTQASLSPSPATPAQSEVGQPGASKRTGKFETPPDVAIVGIAASPAAESIRPRQSVPLERAKAGDGGAIVLPPVPIDSLVENSSVGPLPRIADDGRRPSHVYARPIKISALPQPGEPARIAVLITGLGLSDIETTSAIQKLPGAVTLALGPYGSNLQSWMRKAREGGHEVMLQVPLEPFDYPDNDPGPHTLLTNLTPKENEKRLHWILSRVTGYVGVTNHMGTKFQAARSALQPVLKEIGKRGLLYVDNGTSQRSTAKKTAEDLNLGFAKSEINIDAAKTGDGIDAALAKLESIAKENGLAIAVASSLPITIDRLSEWAKTLKDKDLVLIPLSAAIHAQQQS